MRKEGNLSIIHQQQRFKPAEKSYLKDCESKNLDNEMLLCH
jgi:hypothetical protein